MVAEEVARAQLEILEVERRLALLGGGVGVGEAPQELLEQRPVAGGELVERRLLDRAGAPPRSSRTGPRPAAGGEVGEVEQAVGRGRPLQELERTRRARPRRLGSPFRRRRRGSRAASRSSSIRVSSSGRVDDLQHEVAACRAQRLVDAGQHPPQPARAVRREQADPLGIAADAQKRLEGLLERLAASTATGSRRARGTAGRCRPRTDAPSATGGRSRGSSRSRRRPARARDRGGRARRAAAGFVRAARRRPARCT